MTPISFTKNLNFAFYIYMENANKISKKPMNSIVIFIFSQMSQSKRSLPTGILKFLGELLIVK